MTNNYNRILLASVVCLVNIVVCAYIIFTPKLALPPNYEILYAIWLISNAVGYKHADSTLKHRR